MTFLVPTITIFWKKIWRPYAKEALNIRSFVSLNNATNSKYYWNFLNSHKSWGILLKDRVFINKSTIKHHIFSSFWSSVKEEYLVIVENSIWLPGDSTKINFWNDAWCGPPLAKVFNIPTTITTFLSS